MCGGGPACVETQFLGFEDNEFSCIAAEFFKVFDVFISYEGNIVLTAFEFAIVEAAGGVTFGFIVYYLNI